VEQLVAALFAQPQRGRASTGRRVPQAQAILAHGIGSAFTAATVFIAGALILALIAVDTSRTTPGDPATHINLAWRCWG
jgi:hypothetical protein